MTTAATSLHSTVTSVDGLLRVHSNPHTQLNGEASSKARTTAAVSLHSTSVDGSVRTNSDRDATEHAESSRRSTIFGWEQQDQHVPHKMRLQATAAQMAMASERPAWDDIRSKASHQRPSSDPVSAAPTLPPSVPGLCSYDHHAQQLEKLTAMVAHFSKPCHQYDLHHGKIPIVVHYFEFRETLRHADLSVSSASVLESVEHLFVRSLSMGTHRHLHSVAATELRSQERLLHDELRTLGLQELRARAMCAGATVDEVEAAIASHGVDAADSERNGVIDLLFTMHTTFPQPLRGDSARIVRQIRKLEVRDMGHVRELRYTRSLHDWLSLDGAELHEFIRLSDNGTLSVDLDEFVRVLTKAAELMQEFDHWNVRVKGGQPHYLVRCCAQEMVDRLHDRAVQRGCSGITVTWRSTEHTRRGSMIESFVGSMRDRVCSEELTDRHGRHTLDTLIAYLDRLLSVCPEFDFGADTLQQQARCPLTPVKPPIQGPSLSEFRTEIQQFRRSMLETVDGLAHQQYATTDSNARALNAFKAEVLREQEEGFDRLRGMVARATKLRGPAQLTREPQLDTKHTPVDYDLESRLQFTEEVDKQRQPVYIHVLGGTARSPRFKCYHVLLMKVTALQQSKSAIKHASNNCAPKKHGPDPATIAQRLGLMEEQVKEDLQQLRKDIKLQRITVDTTLPA